MGMDWSLREGWRLTAVHELLLVCFLVFCFSMGVFLLLTQYYYSTIMPLQMLGHGNAQNMNTQCTVVSCFDQVTTEQIRIKSRATYMYM